MNRKKMHVSRVYIIYFGILNRPFRKLRYLYKQLYKMAIEKFEIYWYNNEKTKNRELIWKIF